jgi:hypothetical protein
MWKALAVLALMAVAAAGFGLGRATSGEDRADPRPPDRGYPAGVRDGRAEQATVSLPATDKTVFDSGYAAGAADAFGGFDGGWDHQVPYAIVLTPGTGITYRIASRTEFAPGVNYYLCADGHSVCHAPR